MLLGAKYKLISKKKDINRHFLATHPRPFWLSAETLLLLSISSVATAACFLARLFSFGADLFFSRAAKDSSSMVKSCSYLPICTYVEATIHLFLPEIWFSNLQLYYMKLEASLKFVFWPVQSSKSPPLALNFAYNGFKLLLIDSDQRNAWQVFFLAQVS